LLRVFLDFIILLLCSDGHLSARPAKHTTSHGACDFLTGALHM